LSARVWSSLLAPFFLASCLQLSYGRESRYTPLALEALEGLVPGESDLGACLARLGAPLWVWEHVEGGRPGLALAYGWLDERNVGVRLSVPVSRSVSASLDYDQSDERMRGLVLFLDERWKLTSWRTGLLRDLSRERRRPAALPEA
jgi:hypothetical protein